MPDLSNIKVGDKLIVLGDSWANREKARNGVSYIVTKVGRKLFTARPEAPGYQPERKFRIENGQWNDPNWGHRTVALTVEMFEDRQRRRELYIRVREGGLEIKYNHGGDKEISTEQLEQIVLILEGTSPLPMFAPDSQGES